MPELTELKSETVVPSASVKADPEPVVEDDNASDTESEDTIPELEDAGKIMLKLVFLIVKLKAIMSITIHYRNRCC